MDGAFAMSPTNVEIGVFFFCVAAIVVTINHLLGAVISWRVLTTRSAEGEERFVSVRELNSVRRSIHEMRDAVNGLRLEVAVISAKMGIPPTRRVKEQASEPD
jgi:biopolymer transport protein ExbB/TolQ